MKRKFEKKSEQECADLFFKIFHFTTHPTLEEVLQKAKDIAEAEDTELEEIKEQARLFLKHSPQGECYPYIKVILRTLQTRLYYLGRVPDEVMVTILSQLSSDDRMNASKASRQIDELEMADIQRQIEQNIPIDETNVNWSALLRYFQSKNEYDSLLALKAAIQMEDNIFLENVLETHKHLARIGIIYAITNAKCKVLPELLDIAEVEVDEEMTEVTRVVDEQIEYFSPFDLAIFKGQTKCLETMLRIQIPQIMRNILTYVLDLRFKQTDDGAYYFVSDNQIKSLQFFLDPKFKPRISKINYDMALQDIALSSHVETAKLLIDHGADPAWESILNNGSALREAMDGPEETKVQMMKLFLDHGADPDQMDNEISLLGRACLERNIDVVRLLLEYGADPNFSIWMRDSPLALATRQGETLLPVDPDIVQLLLDAGAVEN